MQFVLQLDFSIVNVALPTMQRELGFAAADLQWVMTGKACQVEHARQRQEASQVGTDALLRKG